MREIKIFPTVVPKDEGELAERVGLIRKFSNRIHIDADDGILTPLVCWPYTSKGMFGDFDLTAIRDMEIEVHLMVQDSREIGVRFAKAGATAVFGHVETFSDAEDARGTLQSWRDAGAKQAGLVILLDTPLDAFYPFVSGCDFLFCMASAQIGAQGAAFNPDVIERIRTIHEKYPDLEIGVDIGVSEKTIADLVRAGATRFGVGSAISKAPDPAAAYRSLLAIAESARL